jgi:hypothetical protein
VSKGGLLAYRESEKSMYPKELLIGWNKLVLLSSRITCCGELMHHNNKNPDQIQTLLKEREKMIQVTTVPSIKRQKTEQSGQIAFISKKAGKRRHLPESKGAENVETGGKHDITVTVLN